MPYRFHDLLFSWNHPRIFCDAFKYIIYGFILITWLSSSSIQVDIVIDIQIMLVISLINYMKQVMIGVKTSKIFGCSLFDNTDN